MKNTYLPLDMIFICRSAGKVVGLAENAEPLSERIISSGAPATGVLEVNAGGGADRLAGSATASGIRCFRNDVTRGLPDGLADLVRAAAA